MIELPNNNNQNEMYPLPARMMLGRAASSLLLASTDKFHQETQYLDPKPPLTYVKKDVYAQRFNLDVLEADEASVYSLLQKDEEGFSWISVELYRDGSPYAQETDDNLYEVLFAPEVLPFIVNFNYLVHRFSGRAGRYLQYCRNEGIEPSYLNDIQAQMIINELERISQVPGSLLAVDTRT